jgi:hypothetical protein
LRRRSLVARTQEWISRSLDRRIAKRLLKTCCVPFVLRKNKVPDAPENAKSVPTERRGDGLRGTTRLRCALVCATSRSDLRSGWLINDGQSTEPTRARRSFGQQLKGDLRRRTSRGSHCPPLALPVPSDYSSLSQHLPAPVYFPSERLVQPRHTKSQP